MKKQSKHSESPEELSFPVLDIAQAPSSVRSMDEINTWIEEDYPLFFNRDQYEKDKVKYSVYKQFKLENDTEN